jgi:outer membrane protein
MNAINKFLVTGVWLIVFPLITNGQNSDSIWSLQKCIEYALGQNISIQKTALSNEINLVNQEQAKASRFPSLSASATGKISWSRQFTNNEYGSYKSSNGTDFGINSSVKLYNGLKTQNTIKQTELNYKAGQFDVETIKESVSLNILDAYLQVLYAEEQVKNTQKEIESTDGQLKMAEERFRLGAISKSDYLQVKSELASENLTLANAQSLLTINKVNLMQLMELPVTSKFNIKDPDLSGEVLQMRNTDADSVYWSALSVKPQIKSSQINRQIADLDINIAKASYLPVLSLSGGVSTGGSFINTLAYDYQIKNEISPSLGLTLSIPIFQNKQAKSSVSIAKINSKTAELNETNTKNQLRKEIEQACTDVFTAEKKYEANREQYSSLEEAYNVALERFNQGLLNSVDFLIQKTKYITAESDLIQSKYNLLFSYKTLDFYSGKSLTF